MLLTCNSCRNTYVVDDATIDAAGGVVYCEQCQEPLVPLSGGGGAIESTTMLDDYSFENLESQWMQRQQSPAPPVPEPGVLVDESVWGEPSWEEAAPYPEPFAPGPTQAMEPIHGAGGGGPQREAQILAPSERTMAIDVDEMLRDGQPFTAPAAEAPRRGPSSANLRAAPPMRHSGSMDSVPRHGQVIVGASAPVVHDEKTAAIDAAQIDQYMTRGDGQRHPGQPGAMPPMQPGMMQPGMMQRPRPIPGRPMPGAVRAPVKRGNRGALVAVVAIFGVILIGGIIFLLILWLATDKKDDAKGGSMARAEERFEDRLAKSRAAPAEFLLPPIEGELLEEGVIVVASPRDGVFFETSLIAPFTGGRPAAQDFVAGTAFFTPLAEALQRHGGALPILLLVDRSATMDTVFTLLYTSASTGRRVLIGGETIANPNLVGVLELLPYEWAAPPSGAFPPSESTGLRLVINREGLVLTGAGVNPDGVKKNELRVDRLAGPYDWRTLNRGINAGKRTTGSEGIRFVAEADIDLGTFVEVVLRVRGEDAIYPNFHQLYLEAPK